jgi:DNA polymerase bacteriophage-type
MLERPNNTAAAAPAFVIQHVMLRDYETRSRVDLRKVGAHRYAADPSTEVLCCAYCVDDGPVQLWKPGDPVPQAFITAANNPDWVVVAHYDMFETAIEQSIMAPRYGFPLIPMERHRCTQAAALSRALPAKLEKVAKVLELQHLKDMAGHRLMLQMSKPRKARKDEDPNGVYWFEDPDRMQRLGEYGEDDVKSERELYARVPPLSPEEQIIWLLDQKINARGFYANRPLAESIREVAKAAAPEIDVELEELTDGAVTGVNQIAKLQAWLEQHDCFTNSLDKKAVEKLLTTELLPPARRALELRQDGGHAAVKKIDALLRCIGSDGRLRGSLVYHKASTGRWAGALYQPQNLKRVESDEADIEAAIFSGRPWRRRSGQAAPGRLTSPRAPGFPPRNGLCEIRKSS